MAAGSVAAVPFPAALWTTRKDVDAQTFGMIVALLDQAQLNEQKVSCDYKTSVATLRPTHVSPVVGTLML